MDSRWEAKPTMAGIFPKNDGTLESNFHRPPACNLVDKSLPYVGLDAKHWEQPTFYCQHQVHKRGTKHTAKTVMKLETGSSTRLHEDKIQQGAQHFSSFPGSWHHVCQRQKVAVGCGDCLKKSWTERHATQSLSVVSYSGVTGGKILQKYSYLLVSCVIWESQRGEGQTEAITVGSMQAEAPQEPFCTTETDRGVWNLVGTGRTGQED